MKKYLFVSLVFTITFFLLTTALQTNAQENGEIVRAYIKVKSDLNLPRISNILRHPFGDGIYSIEVSRANLEKLKNDPDIEFRGMASQWQLLELPAVPDIPTVSSQRELLRHRRTQATGSPSSQIPWGVVKVNGGQIGSGNGIKVAVVDTGVKKDHPDLVNNISDCKDAQSSTIGNSCSDGNGHGTHVAGTIAANGKIKGVAPAAKIAAIRVCSSGGLCWSDDVARGIRLAADLGANIISISLGGSSISQDEKNAVAYAAGKGVFIIAAAGNSGPSDNTILYPGALPEVAAIGAISSTDAIASWSSRGNNYRTTAYTVQERDIEFAAPGVSVESTWKNGYYKILSGTSMATPHVSGLAAKLWQGSAGATRSYLQDRARNNYADIGRAGDDPDAGFGLPQAP